MNFAVAITLAFLCYFIGKRHCRSDMIKLVRKRDEQLQEILGFNALLFQTLVTVLHNDNDQETLARLLNIKKRLELKHYEKKDPDPVGRS